MTSEQMIKWINEASYFELLNLWRFAKPGSPWFQGEVGEHYKKVMLEKKAALSHEEQVRTSKEVGW